MTQNDWKTKKPLLLGYIALFLLVVCLGGWSVFTKISGAIIADGLVEVEINRQVVQHPNGGVIGEILVDDGDLVTAGDVLMRFDDTLLRSDLSVVNGQLYEIAARTARLEAERDDAETITLPVELQDLMNDPQVVSLVEGQIDLFMARKETLAKEAELLNEKIAQINEQLTGSNAEVIAIEAQMNLVIEELNDEQGLLDKGLSQASKVRALQREKARLEGLKAELLSQIAQNRGKITEIEIEILRLRTRLREDAITTLRDIQYRGIELAEKQRAILETLQRMDIRAPSSGVIFGKQFHAIRSVVQAAEPIMYIIPQDTDLVITTKIPSVHVDQVRVGQDATLHFVSFDARTTPEIFGLVTKLSPDVFVDEVTGESYYSAEILPKPEEAEKLSGLEIIPGMPVQAFIKTDERTPLQYLTKPLFDYFVRAFRES